MPYTTRDQSRTKKQNTIKTPKQSNEKTQKNIVKVLGIPAFVTLLVFFALIVLFSLLLNRSDDPEISMPVFAAFSVIAAGFAGGHVSGKIAGKPLFCVLSGLLFVAALFGMSLFFDCEETGNSMLFKTVLIICAFLSELFAGLSASKRKKSKRKVQNALSSKKTP